MGDGSRGPPPLHAEGNLGLSPGRPWYVGTVLATCIRACELKPWRLWRVSRGSRIFLQHTTSLISSTRCGAPTTPEGRHHSKHDRTGFKRSPPPHTQYTWPLRPVTPHLPPWGFNFSLLRALCRWQRYLMTTMTYRKSVFMVFDLSPKNRCFLTPNFVYDFVSLYIYKYHMLYITLTLYYLSNVFI